MANKRECSDDSNLSDGIKPIISRHCHDNNAMSSSVRSCDSDSIMPLYRSEHIYSDVASLDSTPQSMAGYVLLGSYHDVC